MQGFRICTDLTEPPNPCPSGIGHGAGGKANRDELINGLAVDMIITISSHPVFCFGSKPMMQSKVDNPSRKNYNMLE
jgi:hypothetical protein